MGRVNWLAPTGLTGIHPFVSMGPVSLGPGQAEGSWAYLPEVRVSVNPVKSMIQHKLVLNLHAPAAEVSFVLCPAGVKLSGTLSRARPDCSRCKACA